MSKEIKVLHVAEAAGGVERYLETLFKYNNQNIKNILVCSQNYNIEKFKNLYKVKQIRMKHNISLYDDLISIFKIRKLIKKFNPDIVYAHSSKAGALARLADIGQNNNCIYNPHGWAFNMKQSNRKKRIYTKIEKLAAHFCQKIVCISQSEYESALKYNICSKNKLQIIYNGIDFDKFFEESNNIPRIEIPNNSFIVGMVGRLSKQKAPDIFVQAAQKIKEYIPNAFFLMVGDGELRPQIEKQIKDLNLNQSFCITGWVDTPASYMKLMNVGLLLSRWEGFGLVLPEYMLAKVPIIATNVDAIPNIIKNGKNGLLVKVDDSDIIAKKVNFIYKNLNIRNILIDQAYKDVKANFNGERVSKETEELYWALKG